VNFPQGVKGEKMEKKNKKILVKHVFVFIGGVCFALILLSFAFYLFVPISHKMTSCEGIERCYTGNGIVQDIHCVIRNSTFKQRRGAAIPKELFENGGDCESTSHAAMCLCELYGEECRLYYSGKYYIGEKSREYHNCVGALCSATHMGIEVKIGGRWYEQD